MLLNTPACILRRTPFGDYDLIVTLFTRQCGKISAVAKCAKKSQKRFMGVLEPFALIDTVIKSGRGSLAVLQEACLADPFSGIRCNLKKTAFACYWSEIANHWLEESRQQERLFNLYTFAMKALGGGNISEETLSILFQIRFLTDAGFSPALETCRHCRRALDSISQDLFWGDLPGGGIRCPLCRINDSSRLKLTKGTIKKLIWMKEKPVETAARVRFSPPEESECLEFLNAFLGYHLGKKLQSLEFLRTLKKDKKTAVNRRCGMIMETAG